MKSFLFRILVVVGLGLLAAPAHAQNLNLDELITCINGRQYPLNVFQLVESKGFARVDKQWLEKCDRVIYYFSKDGKPTMFVNPMNCYSMVRSTHYPAYYRNEMELQFQKASRVEFEAFFAQVKKQCKFLGTQNGSESGEKLPGTKTAYKHEASGVTIVVEDTAPVAFIYLIR